jgi:battenin
VPAENGEFSLGATSVSDSVGIRIAGSLSMAIEARLYRWQQVSQGRSLTDSSEQIAR